MGPWCCRGVILWRRRGILGCCPICCIIHICSIVLILKELQHRCSYRWYLQRREIQHKVIECETKPRAMQKAVIKAGNPSLEELDWAI